MVRRSPWPVLRGAGGLYMALGLVRWIHCFNFTMVVFGIILVRRVMYFWFQDIVREASFQGHHTGGVIGNLRLGFILFIASEVIFFFRFFWAFFHRSLAPAI